MAVLKHTSHISKINLLIVTVAFAAIGGYAIFRIFAAIPNPNLLGDINNDNIVNATDLTTLLANFNSAYPPADINNNGIVDIFDLATLITHYGQSYTGGEGAYAPAPPIPPTAYTLPGGATTVSTAASLRTALSGSASDIIVADGSYGGGTFSVGTKHVWGQNLGGATFTSPITMSSGMVRGIKVDITSGTAISMGSNGVVRDSWLEGHKSSNTGIGSSSPAGDIVERLVIDGFSDAGVRIYDNVQVGYAEYSTTPHISHISDLTVSEIGRDLSGGPASCGSSSGTAEAALFVGNPIDNGIQRLHLFNNCFLGMNFVRNSFNINVSDVNIDGKVGGSSIGTIGIYFEHYSRNITVNRFYIGPNIAKCFNSEWDYGTGDRPATDITIDGGTCNADLQSSSSRDGIVIDEGSCQHFVRNVTFQNVTTEDIFVWRPSGDGSWASPVSSWTSGNTYSSTSQYHVLVEDSSPRPCPSAY